ncbi:MAG: 1-(5-phosphoribosyl)-5-[(5-phosphoribosylamino)methylideneamino]imidazole-4-carboxamide isomerase [Candidatus Omnitrophica bacterium]|nr:1-(5-phosphoribosyl)-5-[(5-phosphoribosylamino)methylideneamino]imidazole-4-carboxamide isomerase [Candidatus Omnitrophota bacterium]
MIIYPAIDIQDKKVVRLRQGNFDEVTEYNRDPVAMAKHWEAQGAAWLHIVDLDGARAGEIKNFNLIRSIAAAVKVPVQMGGGVRTIEDVKKLINAGVRRVVLGTKVVEDKAFLNTVLSYSAEKIAVSMDCADGFLTTRGWTRKTDWKAVDFVRSWVDLGLQHLIYTDISRDGMLTGPNLAALKEILKAARIPVIASGGVASIEDVKLLKKLEPDGLAGLITGKALYEGRLDLKEAMAVC